MTSISNFHRNVSRIEHILGAVDKFRGIHGEITRIMFMYFFKVAFS
jgi:hypothetical protein